MADYSEKDPYLERQAGQFIVAEDWNDMQRHIRQDVDTHTHGPDNQIGTEGISDYAINGKKIASTADLAIRSVQCSEELRVKRDVGLLGSLRLLLEDTESDLAAAKTWRFHGFGSFTHQSVLRLGSPSGDEAMAVFAGAGGRPHRVTISSPLLVKDTVFIRGPTATIRTHVPGSELRFQTVDTDRSTRTRLRIGPDGNVGIGNVSLAEKLTVEGAIGLKVSNVVPDAHHQYVKLYAKPGQGLFFKDGTGTESALLSESSSDLFWSKTGDHVHYLGGNVSIGTTSPVGQLEIKSNTDDVKSFVLKERAADRIAVEIGTGGTGGYAGIVNLMERGRVGVHLNPDDGGPSYIDAGNVGIGTTAPQDKLHVSGFEKAIRFDTSDRLLRILLNTHTGAIFHIQGVTAYLTDAGAWQDASDGSHKEDVSTIPYGLAEVLKLKPRRYKMKKSGVDQIGFVAQEVEDLVPEIVAGEEGQKGLSYGQLSSVLTRAIQELKAEKDNEIAFLRQEIAALKLNGR